MELLMINQTMDRVTKVPHLFTKEEKEFIVQFAFKTWDKELTNKLIDELSVAVDESDLVRIRNRFSTMYEERPTWVNQIENLLVSIEMYRMEEQKAVARLIDVLDAYEIDKPNCTVRE